MSKSLSFTIVAGDREASLSNAAAAYDKFIAERETQESTIAAAVSAVFDAHRGANLTMPTIEGMALRHLNAQPSNYKVLGKLVLDYVRANADQSELKGEDGTVLRAAEPKRTRTFGIQKGKNGGVCRWSDVPEKPATAPSTDSQ